MDVQKIINEASGKNENIFVFPNQVIAESFLDNTLQELAKNGKAAALPTEKFIAWDSFKAQKFFPNIQDKSPVSAIERQLFSVDLLGENRKQPFLKSIIQPQYSEFSDGFAAWLSGILPELTLLSPNDLYGDSACADFFEIKRRYESFLQKHGLFEVSSREAIAQRCGKRFLLIACDLMNDWNEFRPKFDDEVEVLFSLENSLRQWSAPTVLQFRNSRDEISFAVEEIRKAGESTDFSHLAITVNDETLLPYITREFDFFDIPYSEQRGRPLGKSGAGQIFSLINDIINRRFSLESMKALFLNEEIPWSEEKKQEILIKIENSVKYKNYFEQSFFKGFLQKFRNAGSFLQLRNAYFLFRDEFFHEALLNFSRFSRDDNSEKEEYEEITEEKRDFFFQANNILSRCVNELADLEVRCHRINLMPENHLDFFVEYLNTKIYRPPRKTSGVHILDYKAAMLSPFEKHFVINCTQTAISCELRPFAFLSDKVRRRLGSSFPPSDMTKHFICAYDLPNRARPQSVIFTYGEKTFAKDDCVHPFFSPKKGPEVKNYANSAEDNLILTDEEKIFYEKGSKQDPKYFAMIQDACKIKSGNFQGKFRTSASHLNAYVRCPHKWLFERIFKIDDYSTEMADLIEAIDDGSFKHLIIEYFLKSLGDGENGLRKIREIPHREYCLAAKNAVNLAFSQLETYNNQENDYKNRRDKFYAQNPTEEFTEERPTNHKIFKTLNEVALILSQREEYEIFATRFSQKFLELYGDFAVFSSEMSFGHSEGRDFCQMDGEDIFIDGKIDCVLLLDNNVFGIIDFKRGSPPTQKSCTGDKDTLPDNFQMTAYDELITCTENNSRVALIDFFNLKEFKEARIMSASPIKSKNEEKFLNAKEIFRLFARQFKADVENGDFTASVEYPVEAKTCQECSFKNICRTCYSLASENPPNHGEKSFTEKLNFSSGGENG